MEGKDRLVRHIRALTRPGFVDLLTTNLAGFVVGGMGLSATATSEMGTGPRFGLKFGNRFTCLLTLGAVDIMFSLDVTPGAA